MRDVDELFAALHQSPTRGRIRLRQKELGYLHHRGMETVLQHAADFVEKRLAPAWPPNDGKQTPWGNHPVFVAQHATATCCRGCLEKWHRIPKGQPLGDNEKQYVLAILKRWLSEYESAAEQ